MHSLSKILLSLLLGMGAGSVLAGSTPNQTDQLSPIQPNANLPFRVVIEKTNLQLPVGIHSGAVAVYKGLWVFVAGRLNGLHSFDVNPFPRIAQNRKIYVVNPSTGAIYSRALTDPGSGLNQQQIDSLSVTSPGSYLKGDTLYMSGGYGIDTPTGTFSTKPVLTAIYLPGLIQWVTQPNLKNTTLVKNISQIYNPLFQVAGGRMYRLGNVTQIVFGQNFSGVYTVNSNGEYTQQVRQFEITGSNGKMSVNLLPSKPHSPNPNFRRRDLNVIPVLMNKNNLLQYGLVALSGVFTTASGIWTVPVVLDSNGNPTMADPNSPATFKQAMNNYASANAGLYSEKNASMYMLLFGGMTYGFYDNNGVFQTDEEIPFTNEITTIQLDKNGNFTQYLMDSQYPTILSTTVNKGNPLLFGAGGFFIPDNVQRYQNGVINLDRIRTPTVIGYIVGGIASTVPNTNTIIDSSASPYIFKVTLIPK